MLDEHELVESLNGVFDRGKHVDRVLQLLFMGSFAFVAIFKRCCRISLIHHRKKQLFTTGKPESNQTGKASCQSYLVSGKKHNTRK